jgi:hypothetical protein
MPGVNGTPCCCCFNVEAAPSFASLYHFELRFSSLPFIEEGTVLRLPRTASMSWQNLASRTHYGKGTFDKRHEEQPEHA